LRLGTPFNCSSATTNTSSNWSTGSTWPQKWLTGWRRFNRLLPWGPFLVIAGGVAALGFFSLVVFELETVRAFGIFTGIGILAAVLLEFTFTPAVRASLKPPSAAQIDTETKPRIWDRLSARIAHLVITPRSRGWILVAFVVLIGVAIAGWPKVHVDNSSKSFFSDSLPLQRDDNLLNAQTGGTNVLYVMVDTGQADGVKDPPDPECYSGAPG